MLSQKGFTLVEIMAAGVVSTIVAGALLSVLSITNSLIKESASNQRLGQIQTAVSEQLRNDARIAFGPKASEVEDRSAPFDVNPDDDPIASNLQGIYFCDRDGDCFSGYRINKQNLTLEEWHREIGGYNPFKVGEDTVHVDTANSRFAVLAGRKGVTFQIACRIHTDKDYTFPSIEETVLCRNK